MRKSLILAIAATVAIAVGFGVLAASSTTLTVTPANLQGWQIQGDPGTSVTFVDGPLTPPLGSGSVRFQIPANGDLFTNLRNPNYAGTPLAGLTSLDYFTYVTNNVDGQAPYLILNVDTDNDGISDDRLFFEPVYQSGAYPGDAVPNQCVSNPGCVTPGQWQHWNALAGGWWSLNDFTFGPPLHTLAGYEALHPGTKIVNREDGAGGVRIVAGGGLGAWDNFDGNVDAFTIGVNDNNTTYNFDLHNAPTTAAQCKNGGWQSFNPNRPAGPFKNQGDCIQYVNTGK